MLSSFLQLNCEGKSISNSYGMITWVGCPKRWGWSLLSFSRTEFSLVYLRLSFPASFLWKLSIFPCNPSYIFLAEPFF